MVRATKKQVRYFEYLKSLGIPTRHEKIDGMSVSGAWQVIAKMLKENTDHRKYRDNEYEQELTKDFQEAEKNNFDSPEEKALDEKMAQDAEKVGFDMEKLIDWALDETMNEGNIYEALTKNYKDAFWIGPSGLMYNGWKDDEGFRRLDHLYALKVPEGEEESRDIVDRALKNGAIRINNETKEVETWDGTLDDVSPEAKAQAEKIIADGEYKLTYTDTYAKEVARHKKKAANRVEQLKADDQEYLGFDLENLKKLAKVNGVEGEVTTNEVENAFWVGQNGVMYNDFKDEMNMRTVDHMDIFDSSWGDKLDDSQKPDNISTGQWIIDGALEQGAIRIQSEIKRFQTFDGKMTLLSAENKQIAKQLLEKGYEIEPSLTFQVETTGTTEKQVIEDFQNRMEQIKNPDENTKQANIEKDEKELGIDIEYILESAGLKPDEKHMLITDDISKAAFANPKGNMYSNLENNITANEFFNDRKSIENALKKGAMIIQSGYETIQTIDGTTKNLSERNKRLVQDSLYEVEKWDG